MNDSMLNVSYGETEASNSSKFQFSLSQVILVGLATVLIIKALLQTFNNGMKIPFVGYRSAFEPSWLVRLRFSRAALPIIQEGYRKVFL